MNIFGFHFHNWKYHEIYYDCSQSCFWSSGSVEYRLCKECGRLEEKTSYEKVFKKIDDKQIVEYIEDNIELIGAPGI